MKNEKIKVIIDSDAGVDDAACLIYALVDEKLDVKLITSVSGNVGVETTTRNILHIIDRLNLDVPVAKGCAKAMERNSPYAENIHSVEGLGGYTPPKTVSRPLLKDDAIEAMYKVLNEGDGDIILLVLGPQTNIGTLLQKHPDIIKKIPKIVFMGGSPYGVNGYPNHISFNISTDPEAFKIVLNSNIPLAMIPSDMGRLKAHLDEEFVMTKIKGVNKVGDFIYQMYTTYWEPGYTDKRIATNDTCAYMYLVHPEIFTVEKVDLDVNTTDMPGKMDVVFDKNGKHEFTSAVNRERFLQLLSERLKYFDNFDLK